MGKPSKRPGRAARDVHSAIRDAAASLKGAGRVGVRNADDFPEVAELLHACCDAVAAGVPRFVFHKGRNYWLRVRLVAGIDVFDSPTAAEPLLSGASFSSEEHGHRPGH